MVAGPRMVGWPFNNLCPVFNFWLGHGLGLVNGLVLSLGHILGLVNRLIVGGVLGGSDVLRLVLGAGEVVRLVLCFVLSSVRSFSFVLCLIFRVCNVLGAIFWHHFCFISSFLHSLVLSGWHVLGFILRSVNRHLKENRACYKFACVCNCFVDIF